jgi:hypothetical protein
MHDARSAVENYFAAWNAHEPAEITAFLARAVAEDAVLTASYQTVTGRAALATFIAEYRRARPSDRAVLTCTVETIGRVFRFTGHGVQADGTIYSAVMDVGELDDAGLIKTLTTFDTLLPPAVTS